MAASEVRGAERLGSSTSHIFPSPFATALTFCFTWFNQRHRKTSSGQGRIGGLRQLGHFRSGRCCQIEITIQRCVWRGGPGQARHKPASAPLPLRSYVYVYLRRDSDPAGTRALSCARHPSRCVSDSCLPVPLLPLLPRNRTRLWRQLPKERRGRVTAGGSWEK